MFLSVENIETLTSQKFISREAFARDYPVYPKRGDVLMTRIGDIGTSNVVETDDKLAFYVSLALLKPLNVDSYYLDKSLQSPSAKMELYRRTLHIAFPKKINKNQIAEVMLPIPRSRQEQEQIGALFRDLDTLITLHQRKRRKRLFTHLLVWEQRKFADFVTASGIRNSENLEQPSFTVTKDRRIVPQDEQFENGGTMREADKTSYWIVEPKSFAYNPARINVGSIGYQSTSRNVIVSSLYEVFQADETCDNRFLWHWFKTRLFTQQIEMLQEGGVRLYFFFDKLLKSGISMPSVDEQRLIGEQFDRIDHLITLHQ